MPQIDEKGSTSVEGRIEVGGEDHFRFIKEGVVLHNTVTYIIFEVDKDINKIEGGFETDSGLYKKDVKLIKETNFEQVNNTLQGIFGTLEPSEEIIEDRL